MFFINKKVHAEVAQLGTCAASGRRVACGQMDGFDSKACCCLT